MLPTMLLGWPNPNSARAILTSHARLVTQDLHLAFHTKPTTFTV